MKKILLLLVMTLMCAATIAQTQQGFVKTKGRMVNGKLVPGEGLKGANVFVHGRTAVLADDKDGSFSFPVPTGMKYHIDSVKKKDYELVDYSILRTHTYSGDTIFITMEKPSQQLMDLREKERKLREKSDAKLKHLEDSIIALNISLEEKSRQLEEIDQLRKFNENYIKELAKYYATLDYDRISEFQRQVNAFLEDGEFGKALQLLRTKGNVADLWKTIQQEEAAEAQRDVEIQMDIINNERAKAGTALKKDELGQICFSYFQTHLMQHHFDSAAYYIEFRANVDTTNALWQFEAANYFGTQMDYKHAIPYYERALNTYRRKDSEDLQSYGIDMAYTLNNLAYIYSNTDPSLIATSEDMLEEVLDICDELLEANNTQAYAPKMFAISNLIQLYANSRRYSESEDLFMEAIEIYQDIQYDTLLISNFSMASALLSLMENGYGLSLKGNYYISPEMAEQMLNTMTANFSLDESIEMAEENLEMYGPTIIRVVSFMADLYFKAQQFTRGEELLKKTVEFAKKLAQANPKAYSPGLVQQLQSLGYFYMNTGRFEESKPLFEEALQTCRQLMEYDSQLFAPLLADVLTNLGNLHGNIGYISQNTGELRLSEGYLNEAIEIERLLVETNPLRYEDGLCGTLTSLGDLYQALGLLESSADSHTKSEACYLEVIEIERRLTDSNPQYNRVALTNSLNKLGNLYYSLAAQNQDMEMFRKGERYYIEAIEIARELAVSSPEAYESLLAGSLLTLSNLYRDMNEFDRCEELYEEALGLWRSLADDNPANFEQGLAEALCHTAQYKSLIGQQQDAVRLAEEAVEICRRHEDNMQLYLSSTTLLGNIYSNAKQWDKAYRIFNELSPIMKAMQIDLSPIQPNEYAINLGNKAFCAIFMKKFAEAEQCAREALEIDITQKWIFTNLAAALLLQGKYNEAEELYAYLKPEFKDNLLQDLDDFEAANIIPKNRKADVERIRQMLNE